MNVAVYNYTYLLLMHTYMLHVYIYMYTYMYVCVYRCLHVQMYMCIYMYIHMGSCQNYGPFLGPIIIRHLIFRGPKRGP